MLIKKLIQNPRITFSSKYPLQIMTITPSCHLNKQLTISPFIPGKPEFPLFPCGPRLPLWPGTDELSPFSPLIPSSPWTIQNKTTW